jgi:chemotaxis protein CheY-P-specific phosphatase CheC
LTLHAPLNEAQRDALRELTNVAAGHAASTLSRRLSGERLAFQPPEARTVSEAELAGWLGGPGSPRVTAGLSVRGQVAGALLFVLGLADADTLAGRLLGQGPAAEPALDAALAQVAQEAGAAALAAVARLTGLALQATTAPVRRCSAAMLARSLCREPRVLVLQARLQARAFAADFLLLPEALTLPVLLQALRV